ncbi:MAG: DNA topoisomerase VI, partial [Euryarchaeota archaeon]|nr:DNA topoisomerase VI [Euryarchaeota archaeon]
MNERQKTAIDRLTHVVEGLYDGMDAGEIPEMSLALRSKKNIEFDGMHSVW